MRIAVDLDGMLLAFPGYFQFFFKAMQAQGVKVGILTGRPSSEKDGLQEALEQVDIHPDFLMTMPDRMKAIDFSSGMFKATVCNILKIDVLYDDFQYGDPQMLADFFQHNQKTIPFTGFAYNPEIDYLKKK